MISQKKLSENLNSALVLVHFYKYYSFSIRNKIAQADNKTQLKVLSLTFVKVYLTCV